jgi:hypothetical protein
MIQKRDDFNTKYPLYKTYKYVNVVNRHMEYNLLYT